MLNSTLTSSLVFPSSSAPPVTTTCFIRAALRPNIPLAKILCNHFKDLRNAGFVDAMHENTDDETMMDPPGQTLATYRFQALHNVSLFFR